MILRVCQCCRILYEPPNGDDYECLECLADPLARTSYSSFVFNKEKGDMFKDEKTEGEWQKPHWSKWPTWYKHRTEPVVYSWAGEYYIVIPQEQK